MSDGPPTATKKPDLRIRRAVPDADKSQDPAHQRAPMATETLLRRPVQPINVSAKTPSEAPGASRETRNNVVRLDPNDFTGRGISVLNSVRFRRRLQQVAEKLSAVIPGRAEGASPESSNAGSPAGTGFRARRFAAPRNDSAGVSSAASGR
jgi:hypothetical protein